MLDNVVADSEHFCGGTHIACFFAADTVPLQKKARGARPSSRMID